MEIARHWRLGPQRLRFTGFKRTNGNGETEFSLTGANWKESPNGHKPDQNPLQGTVIYQAEDKPSDNGRNAETVSNSVKNQPLPKKTT